MGWNYLSVPKLQRLHRWSLVIDKWFHPTYDNGFDYLSMLWLKLIHVSKRGQVSAKMVRWCLVHIDTCRRSITLRVDRMTATHSPLRQCLRPLAVRRYFGCVDMHKRTIIRCRGILWTTMNYLESNFLMLHGKQWLSPPNQMLVYYRSDP